MLCKIATFELRHQLTAPVFWITTLIFALLTFGAVTSDNIQIGSGGNVRVNSPYAIAETLQVMSVFAIFIMTAFVANAVVRDDDTGFAPIVRSTRVTKFDYLFGRFIGSFATGCIAFLGVPLAMLLGSVMPWLDPETVGPLRLGDYFYVYGVLCVPTLFVTGAAGFALATATRSMVTTYVGVIVFLMMYIVTLSFIGRPETEHIVTLLDPFGLTAFRVATKYWTATERNSQLPEVTGLILWNRSIWFGAAFALLGLAWLAFRTNPKSSRLGRKTRPTSEPTPPQPLLALATPGHEPGYGRAPLLSLVRFDMASIFRSPAFFVLLGIGFANSFGSLWSADEFYENTIFPVTRVMIRALGNSFGIIPYIIAIFYAGELVWRDRERRIHEIVDATPAPDWAFMLPKILAIALVLFTTLVASIPAAILVQAFKGYTNFELVRYLHWYLLPWTVDLTLMAVLAVFIQTVSPHKFVGWLLMLVYLAAQSTLDLLGFEHNLYQFSGAPAVPLSDMNGQGHYATDRAWFQAYWSAFAIVLVVISYGLWRRGTAAPLGTRFKRLPRRLSGLPGWIAGAALLVMATLGSYIFYNTNVLNQYRTANDIERLTAEYEKALLAYEGVPQPRVVDVAMSVDIFPQERRVATSGQYTLENRTGSPLQELHVRWARDLKMQRLEIPQAKLKQEYGDFNYRIYQLQQPLGAGERMRLSFSTVRHTRGFRNSQLETRVVGNGTFLSNDEITPAIGMDRQGLLTDRARRRKYELAPELRLAKLGDDSARNSHYLRNDSDWVTADITVSTVAQQMAIAPGYRVSEELKNGRRITRYRTETPIMHFFSIQSAAYAVKRDRWRDTELEVYYHPTHAYNLERMVRAMKVSLDYFATHFSAFQFKQARVLEFPAYADFAQSFANTIPYSEGLGFIANYANAEKIDMVTYVTAHEIAHQWWGHQVIGAEMQGMTLLSETLAQYSALMVMENLYGREQLRKFLKFELDRYLRSRGAEVLEELPLERVENQGYIHYQKGGLAMYLLRDVVGEETVNQALQDLLREFAFKAAPYPSSRDFLRHLRARSGARHEALISDLFEKITLYDVKVSKAHKRKRSDGRWDVTLDVEARKLYADGEGQEMESALNETFDVGAFTREPGKPGYTARDVLVFERRPLRSGKQTLTFIASEEPEYVGIDPYNKRIDRNSDDNLMQVAKQ